MAAEEIVALTAGGTRLPTEQEIKDTYIKKYDREYGPTYLVLDVLQKVFYTNNGAREAFVDMCDSEYVQRCTFDSYLYKKVVDPNPVEDVKLLFGTIGSLIKAAHMHTTNAIVQVGHRPQTLALTLDHRAGWVRVGVRMNAHQQRHRAGGCGGRTA